MWTEHHAARLATILMMASGIVIGPMKGQDPPGRLVEACKLRERALERLIMNIVDIKYGPDDRAVALETMALSVNWPQERWTRRGWERVAPSDALPGHDKVFPQALWTSVERRIRQHFDIHDGGRQVAVACELNGTLWTGQLLRDLDPFMRRGGTRCGWTYGEEWLSRRIAQWEYQGTVGDGARRLWVFRGTANAGFIVKHRIWTEGDALSIRGILTTRCKAESALEWRACDVTSFPEETVERLAVIEATTTIDGEEYPAWGWFAEVERTPGKVMTWFHYEPRPASAFPVDRLYAVGLPPVEIEEQPYMLVDRFTGRMTKSGDVDGAQQRYAEHCKNIEDRTSEGLAARWWVMPLGIALGAVGLACVVIAVRHRRKDAP